ncbi:MAG: hypothetical protein IKH70_03115 [Stomatobaculum sp.]|nr:hypothetical protein [Stomatobaculum sp.]
MFSRCFANIASREWQPKRSFAATGWQEEDGTWVYYNKAEEKVTDKWAKSDDNA